MLLMWLSSIILYATFILFFCQESGLCTPIAGPRCNPYCEYHWWFTNVLLSCPWAGGVFKLLMASCWFTWKLFMGMFLFNLDTYGMRAWRRAVETVLVPMLLLILSTSSSSSLLAISSLVMADPLMMAAGVRGNWGRELEPWLDSKGLPASSSGYLTNKTLWSMTHLHSLFLHVFRLLIYSVQTFHHVVFSQNDCSSNSTIFSFCLILSLLFNVSDLSCWLTSCSGTGWHRSSWSPCCHAQRA